MILVLFSTFFYITLWLKFLIEKKVGLLLTLLAFSCSFWGVRFYIGGLGFDFSKLGVFLTFLSILVLSKHIKAPRFFFIFISLVIIFYILPIFLYLENMQRFAFYDYAWGQVPEKRIFIQLVHRISIFFIFFLPFCQLFNNKEEVIKKTICGYVLGTTFQCFLGFYQVFAILFDLPVWDYDFGALQLVNGIPRMNSLGGEPRHLALFLSPSVAILLALIIKKSGKVVFGNVKILLFFHVLALILTFSTSGVVLGSISILAVLFFLLDFNNFKFLFSFAFFVFVIGLLGLSLGGSDYVESRIFNRLNVEYYLRSEFSSAAIVELATEKPELLVTGVGVGLPAYYLKETSTYQKSYIRSPDQKITALRDPNGIVLVLLELGFLGVACMLALLIKLYKITFAKEENLIKVCFVTCFSTFMTGIISYGSLSPFFVFLTGAMFAFNSKGK